MSCGTMGDVERLERLVVHVEEALRLAGKQDPAHLRLALLLLDSAAELLLHRACEERLASERMESRLLEVYREAEADGRHLDDEAKAHKLELEGRLLSATKRRQVDRLFDAKAEYLEARGDVSGIHVRVLRKLHEYRNEAYHRDEVRVGSLGSAVRIYGHLVCMLMRDLPRDSWVAHGPTTPAGLRSYLGDSPPLRFDLRQEIAAHFLARPEVADEDIASALSEHVLDRLRELFEGLTYAARFLSDHWSLSMNEAVVLHLVQTDDPDCPRKQSGQPKATGHDLVAWFRRAKALAEQPDAYTAFTEFADLEDAFEPIEQELHRLLRDIDREVQDQIDMARGR